MLHNTCIPLLERDVFNMKPHVTIYKTLDLDGKYIAFNSYDYRCLKHELNLLSDDIEADLEQVCPTLTGIIKETDDHAGDRYPVRENSYEKHNHNDTYQYLRLLDEALYTTRRPLQKHELAVMVQILADQHRLSGFDEFTMDSLAETLKKPLVILKQLLSVEYNNGDYRSHGRGTFGHRNNQWIYPSLSKDDPDGERVTAFKMTLSINELGCIIKEMINLREVYFKDADETFETCYPLLAILGDNNLKKGIFDKKNFAETSHKRGFATVRYSSYLSSTIQISAVATQAIKEQKPVVITELNNNKCDILPYALIQQYSVTYLVGISFQTKKSIPIPIDNILSIRPSTQQVDKSIAKLLSKADALLNAKGDECDITLSLGARISNESIADFMKTLKSFGIKVDTTPTVHGQYNPHRKAYIKFRAIPNYALFGYMEKLHRNGLLITIYPDEVKKQYEEFWSGLGKKKYSYEYSYFDWSDKSDDDEQMN